VSATYKDVVVTVRINSASPATISPINYKVLREFAGRTNICMKCNLQNEYAEPVANYVCYECRR